MNDTFELLFRHEYSKIVAYLVNKYSPYHIDFIEDAVQEALLKAMRIWPFHETPKNPTAWLFRVANNHLIDQLRRANKSVELEPSQLPFSQNPGSKEINFEDEIPDEQLKMIFACCHPSLKEAEQIMLCLKLLCGLSVREIAKSLMKQDAAVKKAITRAKKKFQENVSELAVPEGSELSNRLEIVLKVIYLLFTEGYKSTEGEQLIRRDICEEAIRLAIILHKNRYCNTPELNALLALMCFNTSRFDARQNQQGELLTLAQQDRSLWNRDYIRWGTYFLAKSSHGIRLSQYHLEAGIAAFYSTAESYDKIHWEGILFLYDHLERINPTPVVALNRLVVLEKVKGAETALSELSNFENDKRLKGNYLYHSIKADFQISLKQKTEAIQSLKTAIELASNSIEIKFLKRKLEELKS